MNGQVQGGHPCGHRTAGGKQALPVGEWGKYHGGDGTYGVLSGSQEL